MSIKLDMRALTDALVKLEQAADALPEISEQVRAEALGHAIIGANRSVYETTPGAYSRTFDYLRGFQSRSRATKNTVSVTVWNDVEYAPYIEYGVGPNEMTPEQILEHAKVNPMAPVYFGRSGQKYTIAGPAVYPAAVFALYRMQELFAVKVEKVLGRRGA